MNEPAKLPDEVVENVLQWMEVRGMYTSAEKLRAHIADLAAANERVKELERELAEALDTIRSLILINDSTAWKQARNERVKRITAELELAVTKRAWELDISECEHTPCRDFLSGQKTCHQCCIDRARAELKEQD